MLQTIAKIFLLMCTTSYCTNVVVATTLNNNPNLNVNETFSSSHFDLLQLRFTGNDLTMPTIHNVASATTIPPTQHTRFRLGSRCPINTAFRSIQTSAAVGHIACLEQRNAPPTSLRDSQPATYDPSQTRKVPATTVPPSNPEPLPLGRTSPLPPRGRRRT